MQIDRGIVVAWKTDSSVLYKERRRIAGVDISPIGIKPAKGKLLVKADEITGIGVCYGSAAQRPLLRALLGIALICLLPLSLQMMVLVVPALVGIWLFFDSFARCYYLRIDTAQGTRKIILNKKTSPSALVHLYQELRHRKYVVVMDAIL